MMAIPLPARYVCVECGETEVVLGDDAARSPDIRDQAERRLCTECWRCLKAKGLIP
jgi:hypothetical protein